MSFLGGLGARIRRIFEPLPRWFRKRWPRRKPSLEPSFIRFAHVEDWPDVLQKSVVYVAGERPHIWAAAMVCPCGCGDVIELNLLKTVRPCWSVQEHPDGSVSLAPSVWRRKGCGSHFVVSRGRIEWYGSREQSDRA